MAQYSYNDLGGNKVNLRSKATGQIKRVEQLSSILGALGDFLVTTWGGIIAMLAFFAVALIIMFSILSKLPIEVLVKSVVPVILIVVGVLLLGLNIMLTNPVQGSQLMVSVKFLIDKIKKINTSARDREKFKDFSFYDEDQTIVQQNYKGKRRYMTVFSIRGIVSPVTFASDQEIAAAADSNLLRNIGRSTVLSTVVTLKKTTVKKRFLPRNATPAMIAKRELQYKITSDAHHNQQIETVNILCAKSIESLRGQTEHLKAAYSRGLVIGYRQLQGKEIKRTFNSILGEDRF